MGQRDTHTMDSGGREVVNVVFSTTYVVQKKHWPAAARHIAFHEYFGSNEKTLAHRRSGQGKMFFVAYARNESWDPLKHEVTLTHYSNSRSLSGETKQTT